ncbi:unnamed protein product [Discosporangium mesarthrocarpum]
MGMGVGLGGHPTRNLFPEQLDLGPLETTTEVPEGSPVLARESPETWNRPQLGAGARAGAGAGAAERRHLWAGSLMPGAPEEEGGLWRRGDAGLVAPEGKKSGKGGEGGLACTQPLPPSQPFPPPPPNGGGVGLGQGLARNRRPSSASPPLPGGGGEVGEGGSKLLGVAPPPPAPVSLNKGVKIVRSYSYHGLGSQALYDKGVGQLTLKQRHRPSEKSPEYKASFFRFLGVLIRDLVKRRHRQNLKEEESRQQAKQRGGVGGPPDRHSAHRAVVRDSKGGGVGGPRAPPPNPKSRSNPGSINNNSTKGPGSPPSAPPRTASAAAAAAAAAAAVGSVGAAAAAAGVSGGAARIVGGESLQRVPGSTASSAPRRHGGDSGAGALAAAR